uniref:Uncharacterized protein n=1 Tax=Anguilla anguilla TaxID=7936 RepID=A0A0E9W7B7_ANGAN
MRRLRQVNKFKRSDERSSHVKTPFNALCPLYLDPTVTGMKVQHHRHGKMDSNNRRGGNTQG